MPYQEPEVLFITLTDYGIYSFIRKSSFQMESFRGHPKLISSIGDLYPDLPKTQPEDGVCWGTLYGVKIFPDSTLPQNVLVSEHIQALIFNVAAESQSNTAKALFSKRSQEKPC